MLGDGAILVCSLVSAARLTLPSIKVVLEKHVHMSFKITRKSILVINLQIWFQL